MAEKLAPGGSTPHGSEDLVFVEEVSSEGSQSEEETDFVLERERLVLHQQQLRKSGIPVVPSRNRRPYPGPTSDAFASSCPLPASPSSAEDTGRLERNYAAAVVRAAAPITEIMVGRSGGLRMNSIGRPRPRTVCVHSGRGAIDCKALIAKLENCMLAPTHVQGLPNGDLEVTFPTIADKGRFLGLDFVRHPRHPWQPGLRDPPPVWVRVFNKPAEFVPEVVERRLSRFGRVLFARENTHPDCPESSLCQGCGSPEHHLVQCDTSFFPDPSEADESVPATPAETTMAFDNLGSEAGSSATDDPETPIPEETMSDQASALDPVASKRSFQDDNVSAISAVRRPSTKKKSKGHSARQPTPS
eukprot:gene7308-biopygen659